MSADRLRQAADKREAQVRERQAYALTDVLGRPLDYSEDLAVIALLRAVADNRPVWPAAQDLADVILGGDL